MKKRITLDFWINTLRSGRKFYKTADLMKVSGLSYVACRATIERLVKRKFLTRLGKELFGNALIGFSIEEAACFAYLPSYLSCEYVLSRHGVIDQMTVVITAVNLLRSKKIKIGQTEISYKHLRKNLFWGFVQDGDSFIAEPEKALLDWLYLAGKTPTHTDEIDWKGIDLVKLKNYASKYPSDVQRRLIIESAGV